jgi:hypothetical protein
MRAKLSLILTLTAWLLATGSHWDFVQTFAWGSMIAGYAQKMPFADAVKKTFSPETMCGLCHVVADAKESTANEPAALDTRAFGKIVLACAPASQAFLSPVPRALGVLSALPMPLSTDRDAPPSPPPRALV